MAWPSLSFEIAEITNIIDYMCTNKFRELSEIISHVPYYCSHRRTGTFGLGGGGGGGGGERGQ